MTQAGPGRAVKQEQEEISHNHLQTFISRLCIAQRVLQDEDPRVPHPAAHEPRGLPRGAALGRQRAEQASLGLSLLNPFNGIHFKI